MSFVRLERVLFLETLCLFPRLSGTPGWKAQGDLLRLYESLVQQGPKSRKELGNVSGFFSNRVFEEV